MSEKQEKNIPTPSKEEGETLQSDNSSAFTDATNPIENFEKIGVCAGEGMSANSLGLKNCYDRLEVRKSPIEGFGVFATADIEKGSVLEEIPFILWPRYTNLGERVYRTLMQGENWISDRELELEEVTNMFSFKKPEKYYFKWAPPNRGNINYNVIPLGFGPIYNTSNTDNNAGWNVHEKTFSFIATRDIKKGEEVCTFYGYFLSEDGEIFNVSDVLNLGLELNREEGLVYLRNLRFLNPDEANEKGKDSGYQKINELLGKSKQRLKVRRISVIENAEEKHPFDFPEGWSLKHHFMKLKEFRYSRFKNIKLLLSYETAEQRKKNEKLRQKEGAKLNETGEEVIITNFNGQ